MILFRVYDFLFPPKILSRVISSEVYVLCVHHINLVSVFGICHEEILQAYSVRGKETETISERLIREADTRNMNYGVRSVAFSPFFFSLFFSLHSFTDNNYKIKVIAVLIRRRNVHAMVSSSCYIKEFKKQVREYK